MFSSIFNALCICGKIIGCDEDLEKFLEMKNVAGEVVGAARQRRRRSGHGATQVMGRCTGMRAWSTGPATAAGRAKRRFFFPRGAEKAICVTLRRRPWPCSVSKKICKFF